MHGKSARCQKCHRKLTNLEAIELGYGPVCYRRMFGGAHLKAQTSPARRSKASARLRKVAGHQISLFEIEEMNNDSTDQ